MALADIAAALNNVPTPWAVGFAGYLGLLNYDVDTLCASPPPATPSISFSDMLALTSLDSPVAHLNAVKKFSDVIAGWLWPQLCQCSGGGAPTAPTPPTAPSPLPVTQPPILPSPTAQPCQDTAFEQTMNVGALNSLTVIQPIVPALIGAQPYTVQIHWKWSHVSGGTTNLKSIVFYYTDSGGMLQAPASLSHTGTADNFEGDSLAVTLPAGIQEWHMQIQSNGNNSEVTDFYAEIKLWCAGQLPGTGGLPCCPPDPTLTGAIANLQNWVQLIYSALPGAASSLAENTVHAGLTGGGTITLGVNTIAIKVAITSDTSGLPTGLGVPTFLFDRGFIVPIAVEGPIRGQGRLVYNPQLYTLPTYTDQVGYQLAPGVTASITELTRGP